MRVTFKTQKYDAEIEGKDIEEIKSKFAEVKAALEVDRDFLEIPKETIKQRSQDTTKKQDSVANKIFSLSKEDFFTMPRSMGEIKEKLGEKGYHYPITNFPPYLLQLIKTGKLRRFKEKKDNKEVWVYVNP